MSTAPRASFSFWSSLLCSGLVALGVGCQATTAVQGSQHDLSGLPGADLAGAGTDGSFDAALSGDLAFANNLAGLMPTIVLSKPQGVIAMPKVMAITYDNDPHRTDIEAFLPAYGASAAWPAQVSEYGIGAFTARTPQHLSGSAPTAPTDGMIRSTLQSKLGGGSPPWGAPDPSTIYAFFFPAGSIVDDGTGSKCCTAFDGYHTDVVVNGVDVPYAILCQCPGFDGANINDLQQLTVVTSHELVEAATDFSFSTPGYEYPDDAHYAWRYVTFGEMADMCDNSDTSYWMNPPGLSYTIQRTWSNAAAAAGHDPCVGAPTTPYYQTLPYAGDQLFFDSGLKSAQGFKVAMGATAMLQLTVAADARSGPFNISVGDYNADFLSGQAYLQFGAIAGTKMPGDTLQVSVTVLGQDPKLGNLEAFAVYTTPTDTTKPRTYYFGFIGQ